MLLVLTLLALLGRAAPALAADAWHWPVDGDVLTPFHVAPSPFERGRHRGIDIAARPGARVRSACSGRVRFAGRLPGRARGVTVACGDLLATHLELATTAVTRGDTVGRGDEIGTAAASHVQLGARRAGDRFGYLDPLTLLRAPKPPPIGAAPAGRRPPRAAPRGAAPARAEPSARPAPVARAPARVEPSARPAPVARAPVTEQRADPASTPLAAWLGVGLLAAGLPVGALARRRRRQAARSAVALRTGHERP
ncbi:MAG TPA: M23 family metallopeptidase [Solirubrobacteraceae bacterium]|nr:M23 family metallopeptidase [Solirubrobacteraceae bacterium]